MRLQRLGSPKRLPTDLLWGIPAIAEYIRRTRRQTHYLVAKGAIPVERLGPRTIIGRKSKIDQVLGGPPEAADA